MTSELNSWSRYLDAIPESKCTKDRDVPDIMSHSGDTRSIATSEVWTPCRADRECHGIALPVRIGRSDKSALFKSECDGTTSESVENAQGWPAFKMFLSRPIARSCARRHEYRGLKMHTRAETAYGGAAARNYTQALANGHWGLQSA